MFRLMGMGHTMEQGTRVSARLRANLSELKPPSSLARAGRARSHGDRELWDLSPAFRGNVEFAWTLARDPHAHRLRLG